MKSRKGRIIKIKKGYNPNCSSGMWFFTYLVFIGILGIILQFGISFFLARLLYLRHLTKYNLIERKEGEIAIGKN